MLAVNHNGYYPLTHYHLRLLVPDEPSVFTLAIRLASGAHQTFHGGQMENLNASLQAILRKDPAVVSALIVEHLERFQCYFTCLIIDEKEHRDEVEKMLVHSADPLSKLKIVACN